ncbi:MAG TPA: nucleoside 2-deoxyribosyltransferase domain-containing protein [Candidatus Bathyarchaeia archaeon]|nr:nucleoside 2-deoxyribosyltransferase domain-containing protein [Candidatus Bathyarchaeia archaeon]
MKQIYFAGLLFSQAEKEFNLDLTHKLESLGFKVFLPQRDGVEKNKTFYSKMPKEKRRKLMFELDLEKIKESDVFLFILDGRVPDEGACFELGIAYQQKINQKKKRLIIGLQTDIRAAFLDAKLNPMIRCCFDYLAENEKDLIDFLRVA